jgi:glutamine cyclotransferase
LSKIDFSGIASIPQSGQCHLAICWGLEFALVCSDDGACDRRSHKNASSRIVTEVRTAVRICILSLTSFLLPQLTGCEKDAPEKASSAATNSPAPIAYTYQVVNSYPHDPRAFTQGLLFLNGTLYESTGMNGESSLRNVEFQTGKVLKQVPLSIEFFGEGLALVSNRLFQLTWQNQVGFVYDLETFQKLKEFSYEGEGWGLTSDGQLLIMSDGTDRLRLIDPDTFEVKKTLNVQAQGKPIYRLNELEYVKGEVFANVWGADFVVRINPSTGNVVGVIDFSNLLPVTERRFDTDVLNGIAYDPAGDHLYVTGKRWPKLYEVRLQARTN